MAYEDLELDVSSDDWTRRAQAEARRDAQLGKATADLDGFFERLEIAPDRTGCANLSKTDKAEILGEVGKETSQPKIPQPDPWLEVTNFVKAERERIRSKATLSKSEARHGLAALAGVMAKVAAGSL
jgi:hypothetical protein